MIRSILVLLFAALAMAPVARAQSAVTLEGQVVCSECWFEADDRKATPYGGDADLKCAVRCSKGGIPQALAVWEGDSAKLYILEAGAFAPEGGNFLGYVTKRARATGTTRPGEKYTILKVDALEVLSEASSEATAPAAVKPGDDAPELALKDLAGVGQKLSDFEGKSIVVLNFWATWCAPCRKEMPAFVKLQSEYAPFGVQVIAASADEAETRGQVVKYVRDNKLGFPVWVGATTDDMARFGLGAELPATVIVGRDGKVVELIRGIVDEKELKRKIDALVEKQAKAAGLEPIASAKGAGSSVPS